MDITLSVQFYPPFKGRIKQAHKILHLHVSFSNAWSRQTYGYSKSLYVCLL